MSLPSLATILTLIAHMPAFPWSHPNQVPAGGRMALPLFNYFPSLACAYCNTSFRHSLPRGWESRVRDLSPAAGCSAVEVELSPGPAGLPGHFSPAHCLRQFPVPSGSPSYSLPSFWSPWSGQAISINRTLTDLPQGHNYKTSLWGIY